MFRRILRLLRRTEGQDLSEYCLLTALVALIALGIFWHISGGMQGLWSNSATSMAAASGAAGAGSGANAATGSTAPSGGGSDR